MTTAEAPPPGDLSAGALLNGVLDVLRAHPWPILLPFVVLGLIGGTGDPGPGLEQELDFMDGGLPLELLPFFLVFGVLAVFVLVALFLVYALVWILTARAAFMPVRGEGAPDLQRAFDAVRPAFLGGAWTLLLWCVFVLVGLVLLIVPGVILMVGFTPWPAVVVAEGRFGMDALKRSWELTRGHRMDLFLLLLLGFAVTVAGSILFGFLPIVGSALVGAVNGAVYAAVAVLGVVYYHRRLGVEPMPPASAVPPPPYEPGPQERNAD